MRAVTINCKFSLPGLINFQALREADNRVSLIWKHQLMQFNNLSESMAAAVVASWPSPAHLLSVKIFSFFFFLPSISVFVAVL